MALPLMAGGCATSVHLPAFVGGDDVTGSIKPAASPLSSALDAEDWRRAKGALSVALDPQGNGTAVTWNNPQSGARGSFTPVGDAYARAEKVCRAFVADLQGAVSTSALQGTACREVSGEWSVSDIRPWKR